MSYKIQVIAFKTTGKYYTTENLAIDDKLISCNEFETRQNICDFVRQWHINNYQDMILVVNSDDVDENDKEVYWNKNMMYPSMLREIYE